MTWHIIRKKEEETILHSSDRNFLLKIRKNRLVFFLLFVLASSKEANEATKKMQIRAVKMKLILENTRRRIINTIVLRAILHNVNTRSYIGASDHADN